MHCRCRIILRRSIVRVMQMDGTLIIVMVKAPIAGEVKTRLGRDIGYEKALSLYRSFVSDIIEKVKRSGTPMRIGIYPEGSENAIKDWLGQDIEIFVQKGRDIGERQASLLKQGFDIGYEKCAVLSTDCPDIPVEYIKDIDLALDGRDVVIGPAEDGGYNLFGSSKDTFKEDLLKDMEWSNEEVLSNVLLRLDKENIRTCLLPVWWDVDVIGDLELLIERLEKGTKAPSTNSTLQELGPLEGKRGYHE